MNRETCYVQSSVVLVFFFFTIVSYHNIICSTHNEKKAAKWLLVLLVILFFFVFSFLTISFDLLPTIIKDWLHVQFFLLCRFIIQILMRCLVPCVWTSSTKLGRHYMISQIFLRASSLNSSLIPIPQIRSMGTQQPCIFTGKYECPKKNVEWWLVITVFPTEAVVDL